MALQHGARFEALVAEAKQRVKEVSPQEVLAMLTANAAFALIDTREDSEWAADHLPKAVHLGKGIIERDIESQFPALDQPMIIYCGGGYRSALATDSLQRMGYTNIRSMAGGMRRWRELGHPVVKS